MDEKVAQAPRSPLFAGRYCDLTKIGEGSMAAVYRARDTVLDQVVALKVLHPELSENSDYIARFKREIALARSITHPNVYRIFDIGHSGSTHFISMEYIDGEELKSLIRMRRLRLPGSQASEHHAGKEKQPLCGHGFRDSQKQDLQCYHS